MVMSRFFAVVGMIGFVGSARGEELPLGYVCPKVEKAIVVDGKLDDAGWEGARWTAEFQDIEGDLKPRPRFKTQAKMAWDDEYFYVAAKLDEPHVWGTLTEHDAVIFQDNDFEVFLDPEGDNHQYYEVEINALGTEWDLRLVKPYRDGGPALNEWEIPGLKKGVHVQGTLNDPSDEDQGWTVEMAFPWKVLAEFSEKPAPPKDGDQWRVNFSRVQWLHTVEAGKYVKVPGRREDNWVWSPQGVIDMHRPEKWGYVQFSDKADATDVAFVRDEDQTVRERLMAVYQGQAAFKKENARWATKEELGTLADGIEMRVGEQEYEARAKGASGAMWRVRQDSRLWKE